MPAYFFSFSNWELVYGDSPFYSPEELNQIKKCGDGHRVKHSGNGFDLSIPELGIFWDLLPWMVRKQDEPEISPEMFLANKQLQKEYWFLKRRESMLEPCSFFTPALIKSKDFIGFALVNICLGDFVSFELQSDIFLIPEDRRSDVDKLLYEHRRYLPSGYLNFSPRIEVYRMHIQRIEEYIRVLFPHADIDGDIDYEIADKYLSDVSPAFLTDEVREDFEEKIRIPYIEQCFLLISKLGSKKINKKP